MGCGDQNSPKTCFAGRDLVVNDIDAGCDGNAGARGFPCPCFVPVWNQGEQ